MFAHLVLLFFFLSGSETVRAQEPAASPVTVDSTPAPGAGEYEIDYEEEVAEPEATPVPEVKKASKKQWAPAVQGSRAKDRFTPILKSETKSVYQKGGKHLDVDPD